MIDRKLSLEVGVEDGGGEVNGCSGKQCDMIGGEVGMKFQICSKCGQEWNLAICV